MWEHLKGASVLGVDVEWRPDVASKCTNPASVVQVQPHVPSLGVSCKVLCLNTPLNVSPLECSNVTSRSL